MFTTRKNHLAAAVGVALLCTAAAEVAHAANAPAAPIATAADDLPRITVTAIGSSLRFDVPATVTVIDRQKMDRHLVANIRDLVKYEPGVSVVGTAGRWGLDSYNIRGLDGNRVSILTDGVAASSSFGFSTTGMRAGRSFVDPDTLKSVEITRGPASALNPSDSLGGTVRYTTKDPGDYLKDGKDTYVSVRERYDSADRSLGTSLTLAGGRPDNGLVIVANHVEGRDLGNKGDVSTQNYTRTRPDPLTQNTTSLLAKYVHVAASGREDRVTADFYRNNVDTNVLSAVGQPGTTRLLTDTANDRATRQRISVGQRFPTIAMVIADTLEWNVYWQKSETESQTRTLANVPTRNATYDRLYLSDLDEKLFGGHLALGKTIDSGSVQQHITYGLEASRTTPTGQLGGEGTNIATGVTSSSSPYMPENYPLRFFPRNDTDRYAVFAQDEFALLDGRVRITPGVRWDHYAFKPDQNDPYYRSSFVQDGLDDVKKNRFSPKLGVTWSVTDNVELFGNYSQGFRPPLYNELAVAWGTARLYGIVPNANLKPETSKGVEIGVRGNGELGYFSASAYYNRYRNFIFGGYTLPRSEWPQWAVNQNLLIVMQSVNFPKATIKGVEASGGLKLGSLTDVLAGWRIEGNLAAAKGDKRTYEGGWSPLNSVDPLTATLGVAYDAKSWGAELIGKGVQRKSRLDDDAAFRAPGYATFDLYAHWKPWEPLELMAGVTNIADRKYWDWGSLHGGVLANVATGGGIDDAQARNAQIERLTMPGRALVVSARYTF
ncbi:TonB-dependent hemoglobin/transferrin/lactoferrin family receptor [Luteibacter sp. UNCMF366Tsu5.1]|uniref:TonB-dependent hemoglobin/transferrin/lactoferrin family receptor n=1 Tax=Luteibacter sp. UNCMF366Tsu5.1 TaxID=1502758 RepID=UPI00090896AF|nr:TonB-dependent hemoglobin/transferrin/lactoferrin family receptor [Luteibacter sp. UNCMF366Tsu5.1]SFW52437.1 hemoglobin/transferrin/lactoferrin receptor protein [Luteibacter sp. UNCMF366Tsu5.1]